MGFEWEGDGLDYVVNFCPEYVNAIITYPENHAYNQVTLSSDTVGGSNRADFVVEPGASVRTYRLEVSTDHGWSTLCIHSIDIFVTIRVYEPSTYPPASFEYTAPFRAPCNLASELLPDFDLISHKVSLTPGRGVYFPDGAVTTREFTDANEPCSPSTRTIHMNFEPSDGGSLACTPYQLFAPVASMQQQPAFAEGVIGADDTIPIYGLIAGTY